MPWGADEGGRGRHRERALTPRLLGRDVVVGRGSGLLLAVVAEGSYAADETSSVVLCIMMDPRKSSRTSGGSSYSEVMISCDYYA